MGGGIGDSPNTPASTSFHHCSPRHRDIGAILKSAAYRLTFNMDTPPLHTVWVEVVSMWTAWLLLTLNGLFFTLRLAGNTGSFPRALTREEEQDCLDRMAQGDEDSRDMLIEHNLRLVAHIVKKEYSGRRIFPGQKRPSTGRRISGGCPGEVSLWYCLF